MITRLLVVKLVNQHFSFVCFIFQLRIDTERVTVCIIPHLIIILCTGVSCSMTKTHFLCVTYEKIHGQNNPWNPAKDFLSSPVMNCCMVNNIYTEKDFIIYFAARQI